MNELSGNQAKSPAQAATGWAQPAGTAELPRGGMLCPSRCRRFGLGPLAAILLVGGLIRLLLWFWSAGLGIHIWDEHDYNRLAVNLLEHGEFAFRAGIPTSLRPPLYPAFVAAVYGLFGIENFQAVRLLQAGLSLATVLLLYQLGKMVACRRTGLWLAGFYCFYPSLLVYNNLLLTEVLFIFLFCTACSMLVASLRRSTPGLLLIAGGLLGLAALTRSIGGLLPPFLAVFLLCSWKGALGQRLMAPLMLLAGFAATIAPWAVRNSRLEGTFVTIDTMGGRNFMMGNYEFTPLYRSWATIGESTGKKSWFSVLSLTYPQAGRETQGQRDKLALRYGLKYIEENPGQTLVRDLVKFMDFWGLERELISGAQQGYFGAMPKFVLLGLSLLICGGYAAAVILGIFGAILTPPPDLRYHALLLLLIVFFCGLHALIFGHSRYHLPVIPFVLLYAARAVVNLKDIAKQRSAGSYWLAGIVCGLFLIGWLWRFAVDLHLNLDLLQSG